MPPDPAIRDHQAWLGFLQPDGLVVSPTALVDSQVVLERNSAVLQQRFTSYVDDVTTGKEQEGAPAITDVNRLLLEFLEWPKDCLFGISSDRPVPDSLKIPLRDFGETLEPTLAFGRPQREGESQAWILLVQSIPQGTDLDDPIESALSGWAASPTRRFERLLRESAVPIGLLCNGAQFRLIYSPRGENSGTLTFPVAAMCEIAGRPILSAFHLLLSRYRLLAAPSEARLPALLKRSRDYQSRVSTALAQQVLDSLYELLRGFQAANDNVRGALLRDVLKDNPDDVYAGLLTVLMRLVFLLYAEDRGLLPGTALYTRNFSVHGLFERLRTEAQQYRDTMEHRYGAWAQLAVLFRTVHQGSQHPQLRLPARSGHLFDPDRFPFLEARSHGANSDDSDHSHRRLPLVSDGTIFRVLEKLLVLDGERLSYRTLDVEQIGSVYETMMGFQLELAKGPTIALKPGKAHRAPEPINLDALLATTPEDRAKSLTEQTDYKFNAATTEQLKTASSVEHLLAALQSRIAVNATPQPLSVGTMVLIPTDERRRTGSHYTPRSLTEPIVRTTLRPILEQLGTNPTPVQILALKVCDPAMGSGAFLVEACRQLGDELVRAWHRHESVPKIPADEDEVLHARRLVAQRCLYGVDKNPLAVDLAKLSLWLATLAKDHPFTFLDHSFRCGDSLVGLTRAQISGFHWEPSRQKDIESAVIDARIARAAEIRQRILAAREDELYSTQVENLNLADESLTIVRLLGDAVVSAFYSSDRARGRRERCDELFQAASQWMAASMTALHRRPLDDASASLRQGEHPIPPFHWEIEFPEVFSTDASRAFSGFDAIVGNPPFMGGPRISITIGGAYRDWLLTVHPESHGNADLVAHFFRRVFEIIRPGGALGLIATKTIAQGDTRSSGLRWICVHEGTIYSARRRVIWPGVAAVVVSVVHIIKGPAIGSLSLDSKPTTRITAFLFSSGGHDDPAKLATNSQKSFKGSDIYGLGFTFDDRQEGDSSSRLSVMNDLITNDPRNKERIFPYIGGEELNDSPTLSHCRYVINFGEMTEMQARQWPDLIRIVEQKVRPERERNNREVRRRLWWRFSDVGTAMYDSIRPLARALVIAQTSDSLAFSFKDTKTVFAHTLVVFPLASWSSFVVLQSRAHRVWTIAFAATMKDDLRYMPSDCFETFPFPAGVLEHAAGDSPTTDTRLLTTLETAGREYYEFRAALMVRHNEGLTKTYNRFHDPEERSAEILRLRELHAAMDRAVLEAYGWHDLAQTATCEFLLDYEDEDEVECSPLSSPSRRASSRRKPWRYRWPDDFRDEVLARLLALNAERAAEERRSGTAAAAQSAALNASRIPRRRTARNAIAGGAPPRRRAPRRR